jgi:hypothetical protein
MLKLPGRRHGCDLLQQNATMENTNLWRTAVSLSLTHLAGDIVEMVTVDIDVTKYVVARHGGEETIPPAPTRLKKSGTDIA